jgi:hypothetical protein
MAAAGTINVDRVQLFFVALTVLGGISLVLMVGWLMLFDN